MQTRTRTLCRFMHLQELLLAMALALVLAGGAVQLTHVAWTHSRGAIEAADQLQEISLLDRNWRAFVQEAPEPWRLIDEQSAEAGAWHMQLTDSQLLLTRPGSARKLTLPRNMQGAWTHEQNADGTDCWILNWAWSERVHTIEQRHEARTVAVLRRTSTAQTPTTTGEPR